MLFVTKIISGRIFTAEEIVARDALLQTLVDAKSTDGSVYQTAFDPVTRTNLRAWYTQEAADQWAAFANGLTPPLTSVTVEEVILTAEETPFVEEMIADNTIAVSKRVAEYLITKELL